MARTRHDGCPWEMDDGLTRLLLVVLEATCGGVEKGVGLRSRARLIGRAARGAQGQSYRAGVPMPAQLHGGAREGGGEGDGGVTARGWAREEGVGLFDSSYTDAGEAFVASAQS